MPNWAIVIGVDKYWVPGACLRGAVNDALRMRSWLLDVNGGAVPERNLTLLLGPDLAQPPGGVEWIDAGRDSIVTAIETMLQKSGARGDRFFFHFSGHGLTARINFSNQSGIVPTDFTSILTDKTLTLSSVFELFQGTEFREQYFFIDACRNMPFDTEKRLGDYPNPRKQKVPVSPQFIMYATLPGVKASEVGRPGNEQGAFTEALLDGLHGAGKAKRWDEETGEYVVRWNSLFEFVAESVRNRKIEGANTAQGPIIQEPRQFGERGIDNPELGRFSHAAFAVETLEVDLDPRELTNVAEIVVGEMAGVVERKQPPIPHLPLMFQLVPRTYSVRAAAPGYVSRTRFTQVDLYAPQQVKLVLQPSPPLQIASLDRGLEEGTIVDAISYALRPAEDAMRGLDGSSTRASLTVMSGDKLAYLELADNSGRILTGGRSPVSCADLRPGFYRARLVSPEGVASEQLIELLPGTTENITVAAAPLQDAVLQRIVALCKFDVYDDNTISTFGVVSRAASLKLSTVLALGVAAAMEQDSGNGQKLRALGLRSFQRSVPPGSMNGVQIVFGDESTPFARWDVAEVYIWPVGQQAPEAFLRVVSNEWMAAIASTTLCCGPGSYWLWLRLAEGAHLLLPIAVLPGRVSVVVLTRGADNQLDLHQYMLLLPEAQRGTYPDLSSDPNFGYARFDDLRRIELMQRSVTSGRITPTMPDVDMLLWDKWRDPIAGCLGGYLLVRMGRQQELEVPVRNLTLYFDNLPDSHVLMAKYLEATRDDWGAATAYLRALDCGPPIFRDGLSLLAAGIDRHNIEHNRVEMVKELLTHVPSGALWSSSPDLLASIEQNAPPPEEEIPSSA